MPGIVLQTEAIKVVNSGGGFKTRMRKEVVKDAMGFDHVHRFQEISAKPMKGTDYIVFKCPAPGCRKRNKKSMYDAKAVTKEGAISFICYNCRREIEVARPKPKVETAPNIILPGIEAPKHVGLFGPDNKPLQR